MPLFVVFSECLSPPISQVELNECNDLNIENSTQSKLVVGRKYMNSISSVF